MAKEVEREIDSAAAIAWREIKGVVHSHHTEARARGV
jgi:hypothetical protein